MTPVGVGTPCTGTTPLGDTPTSLRNTTRAPSGSVTLPAALSTRSPSAPPVTSPIQVAHYRPPAGEGTRTRSRRRGSWTGWRSGWGPWVCLRRSTSTARTACTTCPGTYRSLRKHGSVREKCKTKSKVRKIKNHSVTCSNSMADCKFCQNLQLVTVAINTIQLTITRGAIEIKPSTPWGGDWKQKFLISYASPPGGGRTSGGGRGWLKTFHRTMVEHLSQIKYCYNRHKFILKEIVSIQILQKQHKHS